MCAIIHSPIFAMETEIHRASSQNVIQSLSSYYFYVLSRGLPLRGENKKFPLPLRVWINRPPKTNR